jgi:hypothetical protein
MAVANLPAGEHVPTADQRVLLSAVPWAHYEIELALRGEKSVPRRTWAGSSRSTPRKRTSSCRRISGGIDKLEIYKRLEITEVWFWIDGKLVVHALEHGHYREAPRSQFLPDLDLELLCSFLDRRSLHVAKRDYRDALHARR